MKEIEIRQILAKNLKTLRKKKGLSQLKLANEIQIAFTFINDIENCKKWVSPDTLAKFCSFFDVPVSYFFQIENNQITQDEINKEVYLKTITDEVTKTIQEVSKRFL